jgi:hypothetical protein
MGRLKTKKKGVVSKPEPEPDQQKEIEPSIQALLQKAQDLIVQCDYDLASRFVHRILERQPNNAEAKEMLGVVQLETGAIEDAKLVRLSNPYIPTTFTCLQTFSSILTQSSDQPPPSAHLYLAQLCDDPHIALRHYQAAVDIMSNQLKGKERATSADDLASDHETELRTNIVRALISQVELWMDPSYDLWSVCLLRLTIFNVNLSL